jgi:ppGpp synthetase/RelA/SpoT-type nucleotidyltranferase
MQTDTWTRFLKARDDMEVAWVHSDEYKHIKAQIDSLLEEVNYPRRKYAKTNDKGYRKVHYFYPPPLQVVSKDKRIIDLQLRLLAERSQYLTIKFGLDYIPDRTIEGFQEWLLSGKEQ